MKKQEITLEVDGLRLPGEIHFPETTKQSSPALILCHGIPAEKHDPADRGYEALAERFCGIGFVTMFFNFRGAGLAEGNMDMLGWTRDLKAAIDLFYSIDEVDKSRLCLLGSSGGAAVSVYVAANDPRVSFVMTSACPADFTFLPSEEYSKALIKRFRSIGVIKDADFPPSVDQWLKNFSTISPVQWIDRISPRPLLLIHGDRDDIVPLEHARRLYEKAKEPKVLIVLPSAGHRLRAEEKAVITALDWLKAHIV